MRPRPKFCVGEEVAVACLNQPDMARTEIVEMQWFEKEPWRAVGIYTGWAYKFTDQWDPATWSRECLVHKLPPEERTQWSDCEWQPDREGVEV
jgi:hypothetical protein